MKRADVEVFEKVTTQLRSLHEEMAALAKKSPNDAINAFKLKFVNEVLLKCNKFLGQRYRPFPTFEEFASDDMPSNSDVTFILSQYIACSEELRAENIYEKYGTWYWNIDGADREDTTERKETPPPKKLARK